MFSVRLVFAVSCFLPLAFACASAEEAMPKDMHHDHHEHPAPASPKKEPVPETTQPKEPKKPADKKATNTSTAKHQGHTERRHQAHTAGMHQGHMEGMQQGHEMKGFLGPYPMNREASGTSWLPDSTPHEGIHQTYGDWMLMEHALINGVYDHQGGPRGGNKAFVGGMVMGMAERQIGDGTLGFRAMLSPDPFMGPSGYPLLLATGETADGRTPLIDRQHPHDLFMELATTYSIPIHEDSAVFAYFGYPGEPALGPPTFMHRFSGMDNPEAPITHHWLDSTHITFGVATLGYIWNNKVKLEGSLFTGREPDQNRWDIETPKMDSQSIRLQINPTDDWSFQASYGHINSPEQLDPDVDVDRLTLSVTYNCPFGHNNNWQTTLAFGRNNNEPGHTLDAFLVESAIRFQNLHTFFARFEHVAKDELFPDTSP